MKSQTNSFEALVRRALERNHLTGNNTKLIIAVSGGPNSVSLLHCLWKLSQQLNLSLHAAHLNHMLRGIEAEKDSQFVIQLCRTLRIPYTIGKIDVEEYRTNRLISSIEEAARESRYQFLSEVARKLNYPLIAAGHTANDQTETILMHILRGSGLTGLSGMKEYTNQITREFPEGLALLRPLLRIRHQETLDYCEQNLLSYRTDSTNMSNDYTRNKIRNTLIPTLSSFNPQLHNAVNQLGAIAAESIHYLDAVAQDTFHKISKSNQFSVTLPVQQLIQIHSAVRHLMFQLAIRAFTGDSRLVPREKILQIDKVLLGPPNSSFQLSKSVMVQSDGNILSIHQPNQPDNSDNISYSETIIGIPGKLCCGGGTLISTIATPPIEIKTDNRQIAYFDKERIGSILVLRYWKPGDRFQPMEMKHTKKLQDFFVDMKVPQHLRSEIPLVSSEKGILWVVGYRTSDLSKVLSSSKDIVKIEWVPHIPTAAPI